MASQDRNYQKCKQRDPVLRIGYRESTDRGQKASIATIDMKTATAIPQIVETARIASSNVSATVVGLTGRTRL
jgi:hypothetical protein